MNNEIDESGFKYFEHDDLFYHEVGILQFWWRGYLENVTEWTDPPKLNLKLLEWLDIHNSRYVDSAFGPPMFEFPNKEVLNLFKEEWHNPGEIQSKTYKEWCHRERDLEIPAGHREMEDAMIEAARIADQYRPDHLKIIS